MRTGGAGDRPPILPAPAATHPRTAGGALVRRRCAGRCNPIKLLVVQDTLLAAFEGLATYEARASARTWMSAILRHKITDAMRAAYDERKCLDRNADVEDETVRSGESPLTGHSTMSEDPLASLERATWLRLIDAGMRRLSPSAYLIAVSWLEGRNRGARSDKEATGKPRNFSPAAAHSTCFLICRSIIAVVSADCVTTA